VTSLPDYQIPDPTSTTESSQYDNSGLRDADESDAILNFSWVHTFNSKLLLTVSPFYHYTAANYESDPNDYPTASTDHHASSYAGGQVNFSANLPKNTLQAGFYGFGQSDHDNLGVLFNCPSNGDPNFPGCAPGPPLADIEHASGSLAAFFIDDKFKPFSWLTLSAGMRPTRFSGGVTETAISPRFGAALNIPRLNWTFRAFCGPLLSGASASSPPRVRCWSSLTRRSGVHPAARGARRGNTIRRQHSLARMGT
jgi:hypothetical protein